MEKIGRLIRENSENEIRKNLKEVESVFVVGYSGLSGPAMNSLRHSLKTNRSNLFMVKNSVFRRVFQGSELAEFSKILQGPCGLVFVKDDILATCKVLSNFSKEHETFKIVGGILKNRILNKSDISILASIPGKEVLFMKIVMGLKSPVYGLVGVLSNTLKKFVIVLDQIKNKKGGENGREKD